MNTPRGMNTHERLFGTGPRGLVISYALLALAWRLESVVRLPGIVDNATVCSVIFALSIVGAAGLAAWCFKSLPPARRRPLPVKQTSRRHAELRVGLWHA